MGVDRMALRRALFGVSVHATHELLERLQEERRRVKERRAERVRAMAEELERLRSALDEEEKELAAAQHEYYTLGGQLSLVINSGRRIVTARREELRQQELQLMNDLAAREVDLGGRRALIASAAADLEAIRDRLLREGAPMLPLPQRVEDDGTADERRPKAERGH